jgi:thioesterase DpgC
MRIDLRMPSEPAVDGTLAADSAALAQYAAAGDELLARLPPKVDRGPVTQRAVERALESCRRVRNRVMLRHADAIYDELTDSRTVHHRLSALVLAAAKRFVGLVPTQEQLAVERQRIQAHKDGREIDQGIFFRGLLRSRTAGAHLSDAMALPSPRAQTLIAEFGRTGRIELSTVLVERSGPAAHLTIHNEQCLNAEDNRMIEDLETAIDLALLDDRVRVGVLRGGIQTHPKYRGRRVFSAGINLVDLRNGDISFVKFLLGRELGYINKLVHGLLLDPAEDAWPHGLVQKPWLAAVDSFAIGGGMQLLLVLDRVIAADDAHFSLPAAQEGIIPGLGNLRLSRLTGSRMSRRIILSGHQVRATDPEAPLLCDEVVPTADMDLAVERAVRELDSAAVAANRHLLGLAEEPPELFRAYLAEFAVIQALRLYSSDVLARLERHWSRSGTKEAGERT